ncbi:hypothetical protein KR009_008552 [Drosophila setifemur]|nr:hypothetical protein KR009_008552 [Drosophila setifemur]
MSLCDNVNKLPLPLRCKFVLTTSDCVSQMHVLNYLKWHYCYVDSRNKFNAVWSVLAMLLVLILVFWMMQLAIAKYFCPVLKCIADALRLNESTAGVILMGIAHGSPDFFTSFVSGLTTGKSGFLLNISQSIYMHIFVAGMVMLSNPFYVEANYFLRDFSFLFLNTVYVDYIHKRSDGIGLWETIPALFICVGYVVMTIIDQYLLQAHIRKLEKHRENIADDDKDAQVLEDQRERNRLPLTRTTIDQESLGGRNKHLFKQFWRSIFQFDTNRFWSGTIIVKMYLIVKEPIEVILRLVLPVVDVEKPLHGWSKLLFVLQINIVPTFIAFISSRSMYVFGLPFCFYIWISMVPLSVLVFCITHTGVPPKFFMFTVGLDYVAVVSLIFFLSVEVLAMLFTLSTILPLSTRFSLVTLMNWAICMSDVITNMSLANQGWPRMAFTSTFSSPVFNTFVAISIPLTTAAIKAHPNKIYPTEGEFGETVCIYFEVGLAFSLLSAFTTNFQMRRANGSFLVTFYVVFVLVIIFMEFKVIGSYGF